MRTINNAGLALVKEYEGYRSSAYRDSGLILTIGWGHTAGVQEGDICTPEQAEAYLLADLVTAESAVSNMVRTSLNDNQFSALVSFVFNEGAGQFQKSTLLHELNAGHLSAIPHELSKWVYDNHVVQAGLVKRRAAEAALWNMKS